MESVNLAKTLHYGLYFYVISYQFELVESHILTFDQCLRYSAFRNPETLEKVRVKFRNDALMSLKSQEFKDFFSKLSILHHCFFIGQSSQKVFHIWKAFSHELIVSVRESWCSWQSG